MQLEEMKKENWYVEHQKDNTNKLNGYLLKKDITDSSSEIIPINKTMYHLLVKKHGFNHKKTDTCFLNSVPFAELNKSNLPMYEYLN